MRTRRPTGPQPYAHDADYIEHLILGVRARAHHLGTRHDAIQEAEEAAGHVISLVGVGTPAGSPQVGRLAAIDRQVWADIDARRELEELRKLTYPEKHSVVVERTREEFQEDQRRLHAQIDAVFDLMWTRGENHESE